MATLTWGEIKRLMAEENIKDSDPVFIDVVTAESDGERDGIVYRIDAISFRCGGGLAELVAKDDLDEEDEESLS